MHKGIDLSSELADRLSHATCTKLRIHGPSAYATHLAMLHAWKHVLHLIMKMSRLYDAFFPYMEVGAKLSIFYKDRVVIDENELPKESQRLLFLNPLFNSSFATDQFLSYHRLLQRRVQ